MVPPAIPRRAPLLDVPPLYDAEPVIPPAEAAAYFDR
jgi:hypothetical protein